MNLSKLLTLSLLMGTATVLSHSKEEWRSRTIY
jgi:hypothetical protein